MPSPQELRAFITEHFDLRELEIFCFDYFPEVYADYHGAGKTLGEYSIATITHCQKRDLLDNLAVALQKERPDLYRKKFAPAPIEVAPARAHDARRVFVSHSTKDADFAHRVAADLRSRGFDAWIAPDNIQPGEKWVEAIERGLTESGIFLAVLTPNAVQSKWVRSETRLAIQREHNDQIQIITLIREKCNVGALSQFLTTYQNVPFETGYPIDRLLAALGATHAVSPSVGEEAENDNLAKAPPKPAPSTAPTNPTPSQPKRESPPAPTSPSSLAPVAPTPSQSKQESPPPAALPKILTLDTPLHMKFVLVEKGEFWMGSDKTKDPNAYDDELPQHKVTLDDYYIGKYAVTNEQYAVFAEATGKAFRIPEGKADHPVVHVTWHDADAFCSWLSKTQNKYKITLPTEAQWEKAARSVDGRIYPWGKQKPDNTLCNFSNNVGGTTLVGKYSPAGDSPYGCADMAGNVWEWCADWFDKKAYAVRKGAVTHNPTGPANGIDRTVRGGSCFNGIVDVRCAYRLRSNLVSVINLIGFRVVARA